MTDTRSSSSSPAPVLVHIRRQAVRRSSETSAQTWPMRLWLQVLGRSCRSWLGRGACAALAPCCHATQSGQLPCPMPATSSTRALCCTRTTHAAHAQSPRGAIAAAAARHEQLPAGARAAVLQPAPGLAPRPVACPCGASRAPWRSPCNHAPAARSRGLGHPLSTVPRLPLPFPSHPPTASPRRCAGPCPPHAPLPSMLPILLPPSSPCCAPPQPMRPKCLAPTLTMPTTWRHGKSVTPTFSTRPPLASPGAAPMERRPTTTPPPKAHPPRAPVGPG